MIHKYEASCHDIEMWKDQELEHMGRIASMKDKDLQYSYALSTVNGLMHLRDAIHERRLEVKDASHKKELHRSCNDVIRAIQHLIKDYKINLDTIRAFNERHVLQDFSYLNNARQSKKVHFATRKKIRKN
jgi:uncharacterized protein YabN with tetrapyrrole methylase and pyrophosphatase domain